MQQTTEQGIAIFLDWFSKRAPRTLLNNEHNGATIGLWVDTQCAGRMSLGNLDAAVADLGDLRTGGRLEYYQAPVSAPAPHVPSEAERRAEQARRRREYLNDNPLTGHAKQIAEENLADANREKLKQKARESVEAKRKEHERARILQRISSYCPQSPSSGRTDFTKQERGKTEMLSDFKAGRTPNWSKWDVLDYV
jgi:hypothetical protein